MKKFNFFNLLLVALLTVGFASCSDDDNDGAEKPSDKVVLLTSTNDSYHKISYEYDPQNRVTSIMIHAIMV